MHIALAPGISLQGSADLAQLGQSTGLLGQKAILASDATEKELQCIGARGGV